MKRKLLPCLQRLVSSILIVSMLILGGTPPIRAANEVYDENGNISIEGTVDKALQNPVVKLLSGEEIQAGKENTVSIQVTLQDKPSENWHAVVFLHNKTTSKESVIGSVTASSAQTQATVTHTVFPNIAEEGQCEYIVCVGSDVPATDSAAYPDAQSAVIPTLLLPSSSLLSSPMVTVTTHSCRYSPSTNTSTINFDFVSLAYTTGGTRHDISFWYKIGSPTVSSNSGVYTRLWGKSFGNSSGEEKNVTATFSGKHESIFVMVSCTKDDNDQSDRILSAGETREFNEYYVGGKNCSFSYIVDATYAYFNNGGVSASGMPATTSVAYNSTYTPTAKPTATGYQFNGWSPSSATMSSNKTFTATWTPNTYYVDFDANDGIGNMSRQTFTYGNAQALQASTFTRPGYTFGGWATSATGNKAYSDKQSVSNLTATKGGTVTLYAVWKAIPPSPAVIQNVTGGSHTYDYVEGDLSVSVDAKPAADDSPIIGYQWYSNSTASNAGGTPINGATEATYTLPVGLNAGKHFYYCVLTTQHTLNNTTTEIASDAATVDITLIPPTIDYAAETMQVPQGMEWQIGSSGWTLSADSDAVIDISAWIPDAGQANAALSYHLAATDAHGVSADETLVIPARPTTPSAAFLLEKGSSLLRVLNPDDYPDAEYAAQEDGSSDALVWQDAKDFLSVTADKAHKVFVRTKSGQSNFASKVHSKAIQTLKADKSGTLEAREAATIDGVLATNTDGSAVTFGDSTITLPSGTTTISVTQDGVQAPATTTVHNSAAQITLKHGGLVHADASITAKQAEIFSVVFTAPDSHTATVNPDGSVTLPANGEITIASTTIQLPDGGTVTANADGTLTFAPGAVLRIGSNTITLTDGGVFELDGSITANGQVQVGDITVTAPSGATSSIHSDGAIFMPSNSLITTKVIDLCFPNGGEITNTGDIEAYGAVKADNLLVQTPGSANISINPDTGVGVLIKNTKATTDIADITLINGGMLDADGTITLIGSIVNHGTKATSPSGAKLVITTDGTTQIPAGGSATIGSNTIALPKGGRVNPDGSVTIFGQITIGDITITPPEGDGFEVDADGTIHIPADSTVTDGQDNHYILPDGGTVTPDNQLIIHGAITIGTTTVTPPAGENLIINADGTITAPEGSTVDNSANGLHGDMPEGGTLAPDGSILVEKTLVVETTTAIPPAGEHITIDPNGVVHIPAGGSIVINGETTLLPDGGILNPDGSVTIPSGGSIVVNGTTVIFPNGAVIEPDGTITIPEKGKITVNDKDFIFPNGGGITPDSTGDLVVEDGKAIITDDGTILTPPADQGLIIHPDGTVTIPDGSHIHRQDKDYEMSDESTLQPDGSITTEGSIDISGTVVTPPSGGELIINPDGTIHIPGGGTITADDGNIIVTVPDSGVDIDIGKDGSFVIPDGSTVIVNGKEVDADGGKVNPDGTIVLPDGSVIQPDGSIVKPVNPPAPDEDKDQGGSDSGGSSGGSSSGGNANSGDSDTVSDTQPVDTLPFEDVEKQDWYYPSVEYVYQQGLLQGTSDTTFSPENEVSRAMVTTILYRMDGSPVATEHSLLAERAQDVPIDAWYAPSVLWCLEKGYVKGYGDATFRPEAPVTREETVTILHRYWDTARSAAIAGQPLSTLQSYADADQIHTWAMPAIQWSESLGMLVGGEQSNELRPLDTATRAELADMLYKVLTQE